PPARLPGRSRGSRGGYPGRTSGTTGTRRRRGPVEGFRKAPPRQGRERSRACRCPRGPARARRAAGARDRRGVAAGWRDATAARSCEGLGERDLEAVAHLLEASRGVDHVEAPRMLAGPLEVGLAHAREEGLLLALEPVGRAALAALPLVGGGGIEVEEECRVGLQARMHEALEAHHEIALQAAAAA